MKCFACKVLCNLFFKKIFGQVAGTYRSDKMYQCFIVLTINTVFQYAFVYACLVLTGSW